MMAFTKKTSEQGWFYHAPPKQRHADPVPVPPASQIPLLSDLGPPPPPEIPQRKWIKDSDSKYIQLAKQGGRPDLLRYQSPKARSSQPVGYPRCDWYYLDDNAASEREQEKQMGSYQFMLPDYMVHEEYNSGPSDGIKQKRTPYAFDETTAFEREGGNIRNKNYQIPEDRQQGYGIRQEKLKDKPVKPLTTESSSSSHRRRRLITDQGSGAGGEPVMMGKIMSHGYIAEWEKDRDEWQKKSQKSKEKSDACTQAKMETHTEYRDSVGKTNPSQKSTPNRHREQSSIEVEAAARRKSREEDTQKEPFKLSRFKNVQSKTDSHRRTKGRGSAAPNNSDVLSAPFAVEDDGNPFVSRGSQHVNGTHESYPVEAMA